MRPIATPSGRPTATTSTPPIPSAIVNPCQVRRHRAQVDVRVDPDRVTPSGATTRSYDASGDRGRVRLTPHHAEREIAATDVPSSRQPESSTLQRRARVVGPQPAEPPRGHAGESVERQGRSPSHGRAGDHRSHGDDPTAGSEDPPHLREGRPAVPRRDDVEHVHGEHDLEAVVGERQAAGIPAAHRPSRGERGDPAEHRAGGIHSYGVPRTLGPCGELPERRPGARADVEEVIVGARGGEIESRPDGRALQRELPVVATGERVPAGAG